MVEVASGRYKFEQWFRTHQKLRSSTQKEQLGRASQPSREQRCQDRKAWAAEDWVQWEEERVGWERAVATV